MRIATIIVAAGQGIRAANGTTHTPKQYRRIGKRAVLTHTLRAFKDIGESIVVIHHDHAEHIEHIKAELGAPIKTVIGGASRSESVLAGLKALSGNAPDYVLIHDAARPFVSQAVIDGVIDKLSEVQACAPALPVIDAIKLADGTAVDRNELNRMQTPQGFHYDAILSAYQSLSGAIDLSDDIAVAKQASLTLAFSKGDSANVKLTYPEDFTRAEENMSTSFTVTGSGYDVHRLIAGDHMYLCGVKIEGKLALLGHSDADVGLHAITDAILGGVAMGDIGDHFPPSDPQWSGARSNQFLKHALKLASENGAEIVHVDLTLICEKPKIKTHREAMRESIADILGLPQTRVSVKATTSEGLGFTGRAEGIAAQATVTLKVTQ